MSLSSKQSFTTWAVELERNRYASRLQLGCVGAPQHVATFGARKVARKCASEIRTKRLLLESWPNARARKVRVTVEGM